jgi:MYXO-CTERM domain-containing protein
MHLPRTLTISLAAVPVYLALSGVASAGTITAQGNVTALDDITQVTAITGSARFDEMFQGIIPADQYPGITFHTGLFAEINPLILEMGEVPDPRWTSPGVHFPDPIAGGGVQTGYICQAGGAVSFVDPVTQFGLTAGGSHALYITAWDATGVVIGQVTWQPEEGDSAFVGIDTMGVPIALLTVGNDDIVGGEPYDDQGAFAQSDNWMWGVAAPCVEDTDCFDENWSCIAHACNAGACTYSFTTEPCDDADACTETDTCAEGLCGGTVVSCFDGETCTFDSCNVQDGCSNEPIELCCYSDADCPENFECIVSSNTCDELPPPPPPPPPDETDSGGEETSGGGTETTGAPADDSGGGGCSCSTPSRGGSAVLGLFALVLLGGVRRRS